MSKFFYRVKNNNNEIKIGHIHAVKIQDAANILENKGYIVLELSEETITKNSSVKTGNTLLYSPKILSLKEKKEFFNSFYAQYKSGLPITEIFRYMAFYAASGKVKSISILILKSIEKGNSLKQATAKFSDILGRAYTALLYAGEESGKLDEVLFSIVKTLQREDEIKGSIISAVTYPAAIFFMAVAVFIFFKTGLFKIFDLMGEEISSQTITMILIFSVIQVIIVAVILLSLVIFIAKNDTVKRKVLDFLGSFFVLKQFFVNYYFQNFFTIMGLAYEAGIPVAESVNLAGEAVKITSFNESIKKSAKMILNGSDIKTAFMVSGVFSSYAMSQISAGEKSGELGKMCKAVAYDYERKLDITLKIFSKLIEPCMLVVIGIMVAYILSVGYSKYYNGVFSMF